MLWMLLTLLLVPSAHAVVYLCPADGDGTDANPFRSRALSESLPGRGNIEQRTDVTQPGLMLCESDGLPANMTGVVVLGTERTDRLSPAARAAILATRGVAVRGATVDDAIKELVIPFLPRPKSGRYEIILSPSRPRIREVASLSNDVYYKGLMVALAERGQTFIANTRKNFETAMAWAASHTESFNCSDRTSIGTCDLTWASKLVPTIDVISNQATISGSATAVDYATSAADTANHEVSVKIISATAGSTDTTCSVLGRTTNDATETYYRSVITLRTTGELKEVSLARTVTGSTTTLATDTTDWANNDVVAIRIVGSEIGFRKNGSEAFGVTDATITTGNYGGLRYFGGSTGNCTWDEWSIQDISTTRRGNPIWFN